ncbi:hypothetical protein HHX47_DHR3000801 [Lentinula edodes]|nr:hypothetical protein HHX47_DHR3000801 [Lentinula edodes]
MDDGYGRTIGRGNKCSRRDACYCRSKDSEKLHCQLWIVGTGVGWSAVFIYWESLVFPAYPRLLSLNLLHCISFALEPESTSLDEVLTKAAVHGPEINLHAYCQWRVKEHEYTTHKIVGRQRSLQSLHHR